MALNLTSTWRVITMAGCGHQTAIPEPLARIRERDHKSFWCSTCGHKNYYPSKSDIEKAREAADRAERLRKSAENRLASERRSHSSTRGHLTRLKRRAANGICPCCRKRFKHLAEHVASAHPEFLEAQRT